MFTIKVTINAGLVYYCNATGSCPDLLAGPDITSYEISPDKNAALLQRSAVLIHFSSIFTSHATHERI
jgi:hypothetical protein